MSEKQEHSGTPGEGPIETGTNVSRETSEAEKPSSPAPSPGPQKNKRSSVYVYLAVLFGAAFLMLLLAYFIQQRNNETTITGLQSSWNLSREELMQENDRLEEENAALEARIAELEEELQTAQDISWEFQVQYDGARNQASHLEYLLYKRSEAMELFGRLEKADAQGNRQLCLELIEWMERPDGGPLKDFLPDGRDREAYSFGVADGPTPAERYQEIYDKLS